MSKMLYVGNLLFSTTAEDLCTVLARYGNVTSAQIIVDHGGRSLGFAFVEMEDGGDDAIAALDGTEFHGRPLVVNEAQRSSKRASDSRYSEIIDRYSAHYDRPESPEFCKVVQDLRELAEAGHAEATQQLADVTSRRRVRPRTLPSWPSRRNWFRRFVPCLPASKARDGTIQTRRFPMTASLQQAFAEAARLPEAEQDVLASRLLAELAAEADFDRAIARSSDKLAALAREALAEHRAGQTEALHPERL